MKLNTYLNYGGNCEQAFRFYEQHLGGEITMLMRRGEQTRPARDVAGLGTVHPVHHHENRGNRADGR